MAQARIEYSKVVAPRRLLAVDTNRWDLFPYLAGVMVLLTLVSLFHVWSRLLVIDLNLQISELNHQHSNARQDNGRLRLESASLKNPARIETLARGELGMTLPTEQQVVTVR